MSTAIDTNVPVRLLVRDDDARHAAARRAVDEPAPILLAARAAHLGRRRFVTFDARAARPPPRLTRFERSH